MDSNDIINHIMVTPANTNPNILRSQFDERDKPIWDNIGQLNDDVADINEQLDSTVEGTLANTVAGIEEQLNPETEGTLANTVDGVVDKIGSDETADSILGRITALENSSGGGGEWEDLGTGEARTFFTTTNASAIDKKINRKAKLLYLTLHSNGMSYTPKFEVINFTDKIIDVSCFVGCRVIQYSGSERYVGYFGMHGRDGWFYMPTELTSSAYRDITCTVSFLIPIL